MQALPFVVLVGVGLFLVMVLAAALAGLFRAPAAVATNGRHIDVTGVRRREVPAAMRGPLVVLVTVTIALLALALPPHRPAQLVAGSILGVLVSSSLGRWLGHRRLEQFTALLPDALDLLSSAIRTGQPIRAGLDLLAREMADPLGTEFALVTRDIELGVGEVEALERLAERLDSLDVQMLVTSIAVQKEVGGNLPEILATLAQTIRARFRIQGQVQAYTAQARLSAKVLIALPVVFATVLYVIQPSYLAVLVSDPAGHALLITALAGWLVGWLVIRQILAVSV